MECGRWWGRILCTSFKIFLLCILVCESGEENRMRPRQHKGEKICPPPQISEHLPFWSRNLSFLSVVDGRGQGGIERQLRRDFRLKVYSNKFFIKPFRIFSKIRGYSQLHRCHWHCGTSSSGWQNLPRGSLIPAVHLDLRISTRNFEKFEMTLLLLSGAWGRWFMKIPEVKNLVTLFL